MDTVKIDDKTKQNLINIQRTINELQVRMQIICQTYLNAKNIEGNYTLSQNSSELVQVKTEKKDK